MEYPHLYMQLFYEERRRLVEQLSKHGMLGELEPLIYKNAMLLSPMVATCGPAGPNVAPLMVTFLPYKETLEEAIKALEDIHKKYWGKGREAYMAAARFLLEYVYNKDKTDPLLLGTHLMTKGHTYTNIQATGKATLGILIPPDKGALELRADVWIEEDGDYYRYINMVHDLMHVVPHGERSHPWYPAAIFKINEIYDNSYKSLGKLVWKRG